jgi:hypothetical protein
MPFSAGQSLLREPGGVGLNIDHWNRLIVLKRRALETPVATVSQEKAAAFSAALRTKLRDSEKPDL